MTPTRKNSIIYVNAAMWDHVITPFARHLKEAHGLETVMLTSKAPLPARATFFDRSVFSEIVDWRPLLRFRSVETLPPIKTMVEEAQAIERAQGFGILDAVRSDRHVGAGFVTGARVMKSSYAQRASFEQVINLALRIYASASELLDRVQPIAILGNAGMIHTTILVNLAEARGIPVRSLGTPRRGNSFFWCANRFGWPADFARDYRSMLGRDESRATEGEAAALAYRAPDRAAKIIRAVARPPGVRALLRRVYGVLRSNWRQIAGINSASDYGAYSVGDKLIMAFWSWRQSRAMANAPHMLPSVPAGVPTVFFPLTTEPEGSLMVESLACDTQLVPIDWLAKTLPTGWRLLVKEHPVMNLPRPRGFWERIRAYPNVVVLAPTESADAVIDRSAAVAVIGSTVGLQAAARGKPVICFNPNYIATVLPHALTVSSYETTAAALRRVRDDELPPMPERLRAMKAYLDAYANSEFPISEPALLSGHPGKKSPAPELIATLVETFLRSLGSARKADAA